MRELSLDQRKRKKEIELYLREKNRWSTLPPLIKRWVMMDDEIDKVTFISQNPDNIDGKIRRGTEVEYNNLEDMLRDISIYEEYGLINIRPGKGESGRKGVRLSFMVKEDIEIEKVLCIVKEIKEDDFLSSIMKGKLPNA